PSSLTPCPSFPHLPSFFFFFFNDTATTAIYTLSLHVALPIWPPSAGLIVITAQRGGSFRESIAMAKSYVEARQDHGASELLDEIVSAKPERDHTRYHSPEELKQAGLKHLRDAVALLEQKATPEEVEDYRKFVL